VLTVREAVAEVRQSPRCGSPGSASQLLDRLGLRGDAQSTPAGELYGGERRGLQVLPILTCGRMPSSSTGEQWPLCGHRHRTAGPARRVARAADATECPLQPGQAPFRFTMNTLNWQLAG